MELFEKIRREYEYGEGTINGVARKLGIHRRMVREALGDANPRERKISTRGKPRLEPAKAFIEAILQGDENAPRKQRHTAHRIWSRIREELPAVSIAESSIRRYVRERKIELGLVKRETFIPQSYAWGQEAQVDWYEAYADIGGEREKAYVFCMRSMASGGAFHCAFPHCSQQAFLEAHELGFAYFLASSEEFVGKWRARVAVDGGSGGVCGKLNRGSTARLRSHCRSVGLHRLRLRREEVCGQRPSFEKDRSLGRG